MKDILLALSVIITLVSVIPYLRDILRGTTKPNLVSWITWTLLTGIATAAELAAGEYVAAIFTSSAVVETGSVVVLGLIKRACVRYTRFDVICQISAIVGIILWQLFDSPAVGVIASVTIDFVGALPTLRHCWEKPGEETWPTYALAGLAGLFAILALDTYNVISLPYPIYIMLINFIMAVEIIGRKRVGITP